MQNRDPHERRLPVVTPQGREEYVPPELTVYGTVEELTQNVGTLGSDGITGSRLV